jgi:hypothetical protein
VIVIDVLRTRLLTHRAHAALCSQHLVHLCLPDAVAPPKVILAGAAVVLDPVLAAACVVARLAIATDSGAPAAVSREVLKILKGLAIGTPLLTRWRDAVWGDRSASVGSRVVTRGHRTHIHARLAVTSAAVASTLGR